MQKYDALTYFLENGVSPFGWGDVFPQSLGKLLEIKKVKDPDAFIAGLNKIITEKKNA